ncbi:MAG: hypothetical protein OEY29_13380 [Gammaproteobacteria bacterium]|nr:hypothetical protein [Gammaproteobacteria bacterium]
MTMLYFIGCYAPDLNGAKVADGLARVSLSKKSPHIAFATRELAQYYIDYRKAGRLCYLISEEKVSDTIWHDFNDGIVVFKTIKDLRKTLEDTNNIDAIEHMSYSLTGSV